MRACEVCPSLRASSRIQLVDFSAGDGRFVDCVRRHVAGDVTVHQCDIEPRDTDVTREDWLSDEVCVRGDEAALRVVGFNPPFGRAGRLAFAFVERALERLRPDIMILVLPVRNWFLRGYRTLHRAYLARDSFYVPDTRETFNASTEFVVYERAQGEVRLLDNWRIDVDTPLSMRVRDTGTLERTTLLLLVRKVGEYAGRQAYYLNRECNEVYYFSANGVACVYTNVALDDASVRAGNTPWTANGHIVCSLDPPTAYSGSNPRATRTTARRQGTGFLKCTGLAPLTSDAFFRVARRVADDVVRFNLNSGTPRSISAAILCRLWCDDDQP